MTKLADAEKQVVDATAALMDPAVVTALDSKIAFAFATSALVIREIVK